MSGLNGDAVREYRHLSTLLAKEDSGLSDEERLDIARRLTEFAPAQPDSWWSVATQIDFMLRDLEGEQLRTHPLFPELVSAWDRAMSLDQTEAAAAYNLATALNRAGLSTEAYRAFMLAGRIEMAHPSADIEWPAEWHFESAAAVALECGAQELALAAAQAAIDSGAPERDAASLLERIRHAADSQRPT